MGLTDSPDHDGKVTLDINFILRPYYRSLSVDTDFLYESLLDVKLLWATSWNNEYESENESASQNLGSRTQLKLLIKGKNQGELC